MTNRAIPAADAPQWLADHGFPRVSRAAISLAIKSGRLATARKVKNGKNNFYFITEAALLAYGRGISRRRVTAAKR